MDIITQKKFKDLQLNEKIITNIDFNNITVNNISIDNELNLTSENPVQNKVVTTEISLITENIDNLEEDINEIDSNKINIDDLLSNINSESDLPVKSSTIYNELSNLNSRIESIEMIYKI